MATPQESTTTVSGRRCTRSRARTAATSVLPSEDPAQVTPTELNTSTPDDAQQIQTSAAEPSSAPPPPPPPPPPAPPLLTPEETRDAAPTTALASSAIGTDRVVSSSPAPSLLADLKPSSPVAAAPSPVAAIVSSGAIASAAAVPTTPLAALAAPESTRSDSNNAAVTSVPVATPTAPSGPAVPAESSVQSPADPEPEQPIQSSALPQPVPDIQPQPPQPTTTGVPPGGEAGMFTPDQGSTDNGSGLTIANGSQTNVGGIIGGVVGGVFGIALISGLLFLCLRRRRKEPFEKWQQRMSEKNQGESGLGTKLKAVREKVQGVPAAVAVFVAKLKGKKSGPAQNPYRRHSVRSSVSSVYSTPSHARDRSVSEAHAQTSLRQQLRGLGASFGDRMPSLKKSRTLLHKKEDSLVVGPKSPFPGIVGDPVVRNSNGNDNPFADPEPLEPPRNLTVLNPDPSSREGSPKPERVIIAGLQNQQRGPVSPKPAMSNRISKDPFASILDEIDKQNGSGTPEWLRDTTHKRTQSSQTALHSHPTSSFYSASNYTPGENPFIDPYEVPAVPTQPLPPNPPARPANTYTGMPTFNTTSSIASRESQDSFFFGEPGPSRPSTNLFHNPPRAGRQSDPFDLDRPEVLGFGNVMGRREVHASVTRQASRNNRRSSVPNWVRNDDGTGTLSGLMRNGSTRR